MAPEKAWEEEECMWEQARLAVEARAQEEKQCAREEEERLTVERALREVEGPTVTAVLAIIGFRWKSRGGGGEGGEPT